jgi:cation-transporting ATPase F
VAACHTAGIAVKMITGDHATTATAIASQVGLLDGHEHRDRVVLTGAELAELPAEEFPDAVDQASVFARVHRSRSCGWWRRCSPAGTW